MQKALASLAVCLSLAACASTGTHAPVAYMAPGEAAASAEPSTAVTPSIPAAQATGYFIEFRARSALSYGHTFAVHGRLNAQQEIIESTVVGLHPRGDSPVPWMIGHVIPVPSETSASDGDTENEYITARFRLILNESEYKGLLAYIRELEASSPMWHAAFYNCNMYVQQIAKHLGLRTPFTIWLKPKAFITKLGELNHKRALVASAAP